MRTQGAGACSGPWFALPDMLARAGWHVLAVDLPPFGLSRAIPAQRPVDSSRPAQA